MRIDLAPGDDVIALVRAAQGPSIVVVIPPGRDALGEALVEAAIGPLAVERAPDMRVNAVFAGTDAATTDAAAAFLDVATSTTGQVLRLS